MSRTPARFTQADLNRAMKIVAKLDGYRVRITQAGDIIVERGDGPEPSPVEALEAREAIAL